MTGPELQTSLNLDKFERVYIQKAIRGPGHVYVVSVNSRYPTKPITYWIMKSTLVSNLKLMKSDEASAMKLTPPVELKNFRGHVSNNAIIMVRDLSGDMYIKDEFYV